MPSRLETVASLAIVSIIINICLINQYFKLGTTTNSNPHQKRLLLNKEYSSIELFDSFHPLDPLTKDELFRGIMTTKKFFDIDEEDNITLIIHQWQNKFPNKQQVIDFLYNPHTILEKNDFPRIIDMDISVLQTDKKRRNFYNIQIDTQSCHTEIVSIKDINSTTGYPKISNSDFAFKPSILFNNSKIYSYFTKKLKIPSKQLVNIVCAHSSPHKFIIGLLQNKIPNIEDIFKNNRLGLVNYCFDQTFVIENPTKNHIPFLGLIDYDLGEIIHFWQCDDDEMNLDCKIPYDYTNKNEYVWSNKISLNDLNNIGLNIDDIDNECSAQRILNKGAVTDRITDSSSSNTREIHINNNNQIKWDKWTFHQQFNKREGPRLSDIRFLNRSIIYELTLSEVYVPYYDFNSILWYSYAFLDIGHYNLLNPTVLNNTECPTNSIFLKQNAILNEDGSIAESPIYACLFERYTKQPRVRHGDKPYINTAPNIELVYRTAYTTGNYDYLISYIFKLDGSIKISVSASGYNLVSPIVQKNSLNNNKYCNLLSENYCSTFHDHFFSFRIDIDVDEYNNNFYHGLLRKKKVIIGNNNKVSNGWYYHERLIKKELNAMSTMIPNKPKHWVFRSTSNEYFNKDINYQTGYEISPQSQNIMLGNAQNDVRDNQASWANKGIWVTKYNENELFSSGRYTWQPLPNQGVINYIQNNDNIYNEDIVAWVTLGFHHVTRSDDLPVLPMQSHDIIIKPFNFFSYTPASCGDDIV